MIVAAVAAVPGGVNREMQNAECGMKKPQSARFRVA